MINVLIISHSLIPSVLLCGDSQLNYLKTRNIINYKFIPAHLIRTDVLSWANIIIFVRSESELEAYASDLCRKANKHLIYVLDDDIINIPDNLSSSSYYLRKDIQENIKKIMNNCSTFLTSSPVMLEKYGKQFKYAYQIHEPSLNVIEKKEENKKIKIGFAGSIDRTQDINDILEESLIKIIDNYKDKIEIEFMGAKPDIVTKYKLTHIPYTDSYEKYTEVIKERNWDIGLAPMPDTKFHNCKYFNKYVEYASFGIAGIYSNVKPYTFGIKNKENGILANNNSNDWFNAISLLIENKKLRKTISNNCLYEAKTIYSLETLSNDYLNKIMTGFNQELSISSVKGLWKFRIKTIFNKIIYKIKEQGIMLPVWFVKKIYRIITKQQ